MSKAKRNTMLLLFAAGLLIVILAMSLPRLVLLPGEPFSLAGQSAASGEAGTFPGGEALVLVVRGIIALVLILLPFYIIYNLMTARGRLRLLVDAVLLVIIFLIVQYLHDHPFKSQEAQQQPAINSPSPLEIGSQLPKAIFTANPPAWLTPVILIAASMLLAAFLLSIYWLLRLPRKMPDSPLDKLAEAAQNTIVSIQSGGNLKMSVIQCYREMMQVVKEEKGVARETAMTPREFEERLIHMGLPQETTHTLTRLFEQVRYGSLPPSSDEERLALTCLMDIMKACGGQHEA